MHLSLTTILSEVLVIFILIHLTNSVGWHGNYNQGGGYTQGKQFYPRSNNDPKNSSVIWTPQSSYQRQSPEYVLSTFPNQRLQMDTFEQHKQLCMSLNGFTKTQRSLCLKYPGLILVMGEGAALGLTECIHQFQHDKWNCSSAGFIRDKSSLISGLNSLDIDKSLSRLLQKGTKERAFLSATWAAGSVDKLTRACSLGTIPGCQCDPRRMNSYGSDIKGQFYWSGCSDHINFGMRLTRRFLESVDHENLENELMSMEVDDDTRRLRRFSDSTNTIDPVLNSIQKKAKSFMNLHNTKVGILAIWQHRRKECRCNGPSGTCTMRFCYHKIGNFRNVGNYIKNAYASAIRVSYRPEQNRLVPSDNFASWYPSKFGLFTPTTGNNNMNRYTRGIHRRKRDESGISKRVLVYLEDSPNYCHPDPSISHHGVVMRECDGRNASAPNSCHDLCCGHGFETLIIEQPTKCKCKFIWCCEVKCEICIERKTIHRCKPGPIDPRGGLTIRGNQFSSTFYNQRS